MAQHNWIGETLSQRYEIIELLGEGGMSAVYKANDPNLRRVVAIKIIHPHLSRDPAFVRRFEEEAAAVAQLRHPNLIQVFDFNRDGDTFYIVFEFVPGETLQSRLQRLQDSGRMMPTAEVVSLFTQVADGLHYAHNKGLIHRDIKPANIMINVQGNPIIMDFGIAKIVGGTQHTATGAVLGTARYMSPEQIKGERIEPATDIYSLGVTLFEALGGRPPFQADSAMTLMMMHISDPVPNLLDLRSELPASLVLIVNRMLEKPTSNRYRAAAEIVKALRHFDQPTAPTPPPQTQPPVEERPVAATIVDPQATEFVPQTAATPAAAMPQPVAAKPPAARPQTSPASAPAATGGFFSDRRNQMIIGGIALVAILALGIWGIFFRDTGGENEVPATIVAGVTEAPQVTATNPPAATATTAATATSSATESAEAVALTVEAIVALTAAAEEPTPRATDTPPPTPTPPAAETLAFVSALAGEVTMLDADDVESQVNTSTYVYGDSQLVTGDDGGITLALGGGNSLQLTENSNLWIDTLVTAEANEATSLRLVDGSLLILQPETKQMVTIASQDGTLLAVLSPDSTTRSASRQGTAKLLLQEDMLAGAISVRVDGSDVFVACFAGECTSSDGSQINVGWEHVLTLGGETTSTTLMSRESESYILWQSACPDCLKTTTVALATAVPPTPTPALPPTPTAPPPTATPETVAFTVRITSITLDSGRYTVNYETTGYTEQLPGMHVHFYFDTVPESQAGLPGGGPWFVYGGPRPFRGYGESDRPGAANNMCASVANTDHSIIAGSGNCFPLP